MSTFTGTPADIEALASKVRTDGLRVLNMAEPHGFERVREFLVELTKLLGGEVQISPVPLYEDKDGGSLVVEPGGTRFVIRLSPFTSPLRDNFTTAHELGHFFLHYPHGSPKQERMSFNRAGSDRQEIEANRFAAALLMPEAEFKRAIKTLKDNYSIAAKFGVSEPAVRVRRAYVR